MPTARRLKVARPADLMAPGQRAPTPLRRGDAAELRRRLERYYWAGRLDGLVLVAALFVMTTKPFL